MRRLQVLFLKVRKSTRCSQGSNAGGGFGKSMIFLVTSVSVTCILRSFSAFLSYSVYLGKPIQSLSLSIRPSLSLKRTRSLSLKPPTPNSLSLKPILPFPQILYIKDLGLSMFLCFDFRRRGFSKKKKISREGER